MFVLDGKVQNRLIYDPFPPQAVLGPTLTSGPADRRSIRQPRSSAPQRPWAGYMHEADERGIASVRYQRIVPKDDECAKQLKKRTLTNLYNQRPTWLDLAHRKLDKAVFAAYGWPPELSDEDLLAKLLDLNFQRASELT